jgi:outer membrane assembly lipoprotein YfiO
MRSIRLFVLLALVLALPACSLFHGKRDNLDTMTVEALYDHATTALKNSNYGGAEQLYNKLIARFPYGPYTERAQINLAYAQFKNDQPDDAYATANRYIKTYPAAKDIAYAYYLRGLINFNRSGGMLSRIFPVNRSKRDQGYAVQSFDDFSQLLQRFPTSPYAQDARQRMIWLRNGLAQFEMNIAFYYYERQAYIASLNRAKYVLEHYQQAPQTGDALALMVQSYKRLDDPKLADQALAVLKLNYPDHPYFKHPNSWPHYSSDLWRLIPFMGGFGVTDSGVTAASQK